MKFDKGVGDLGLTVTCSYVKLVIFFQKTYLFRPDVVLFSRFLRLKIKSTCTAFLKTEIQVLQITY